MLKRLGILKKHGETVTNTFAPERDVDGHLLISVMRLGFTSVAMRR
jgi:hypothetical protein